MTRHLEAWRLSGACASHPLPDLWFDDDPAAVAHAKQVCARCPVRDTCLADALARGEAFGVLGGFSGPERRGLAAREGLPRPSMHGAAQHGQRSRYLTCTDGPDGGKCALCRRGNAAYKAGWVARRSPVTARPTLVVAVLDRPSGRGLHRAWPGQTFIKIGAA